MKVPVADQRIMVGTVATARAQLLDQDGDPITPTGAVTVGVVDLAGAVVLAAGTATTTPSGAPTIVAVTLPEASQLDVWTATWSEADGPTVTTRIEVVGGYYAGVQSIRSSDSTLADSAAYPDARIVAARRAVEDEFERVIGYALVPRIAAHAEQLDRAASVVLPHFEVRSVRSVTVDGVAVTDYTLAGPAGYISFDDYQTGELEVVYEHGLDRPTGEALDAFFTRVRDVLNRDRRGLSDRTTTFTSEIGGTYALAVAGRGGSLTGIPDVDVVLKGLQRSTPGIA